MKKFYKWYKNGRLVKESLDPEGEKVTVEYFPNNVTIRRNFHSNRVGHIFYYQNGKLHREEGPAAITFNYTGSVRFEEYFQNGELHRDPNKGPAFIEYLDSSTGLILREEFYFNGLKVIKTPEGWEREDWG